MSCYSFTTLIISIFTFITCVVSFVTPYWLVSWDQKLSTFHRIGMWEVCVTAFTDPKMYAFKYYDGCWWIFHSELDQIRGMLNPAWFKAVQAFSVMTLIASILYLIMMILNAVTKAKRRYLVMSAALSFITAFCGLMCTIIFGACAKDPQMYRLPMPQYNYFSFSYGMIIMCALFAGFGFAFSLGALSEVNEERKEKH